ncbi:MAG: CoA transferase [Gemmatimonadaceae bacterium]|nr:CoA transferase [Gemmatimonadaceae bacterium]
MSYINETATSHHSLNRLKVLDLTRVLAGPLCTMLLGDMGANVIKIERPEGGDETRGWGPPFDHRGESAYYLSVNRNKISVSADLSTADGIELVRRLAAEADVVVENFRPGMLEKRGLGAESLLAANQRLVWCTITGFGDGLARPGYDFVVQAESGWMSITGDPDGEPVKHGIALVDVIAGKDAALAILGALVARGGSGIGRRVTVSLAASAQAALVNVAQNALVSGAPPRRWGNAHANLVPYQLFHATDRALVIAVGNDAQWTACARALDLDPLARDPSLATNAGRLAQRTRVTDSIASRVRERAAAHWIARLDTHGVPCGVVRTIGEVLATVDASPLYGMPVAVPGSVRRPPPMLGEHTEIVTRHGWDAFSTIPGENGKTG